ncbi:MAG: hypothetical protein QXT45_05905 [Candidatus Bilamarchaeaceae archaeon]
MDKKLVETLTENAVIAGLATRKHPTKIISEVALAVMECLDSTGAIELDAVLGFDKITEIADKYHLPSKALVLSLVKGGLYTMADGGLSPTDKAKSAIESLKEPTVRNVLMELLA